MTQCNLNLRFLKIFDKSKKKNDQVNLCKLISQILHWDLQKIHVKSSFYNTLHLLYYCLGVIYYQSLIYK